MRQNSYTFHFLFAYIKKKDYLCPNFEKHTYYETQFTYF